MLFNYQITTGDKQFTMLSPDFPEQALINAQSRWPDCSCEPVGGFVNQISLKICALSLLESRRAAINSIPDKYKQLVKDAVLARWTNTPQH